MTTLLTLAIITLFIVTVVAKSIALIPQGEAAVIERLGSYTRTVSGGLTLLVPFIDRVRAKVDTRERVVSFPPQAVITQDNLTVAIDIVVTFQINDAAKAIYGVDNYIVGVEQISVATLRDVVGGMTLEETLTSRDVINRRLRGELDAATTRWGLRISRVELKAIDPPPSIQQSMEMQMKADREKRAMILTAEGRRESDIRTAEGEKQAKILAAEGEKHAAILAAEADRQATILRAEGERAAKYLSAQGEARAIQKVNAAITASQVTPEILAYHYLENMPKIAEGQASTMWMIPSQFGDALEDFAKTFAKKDADGVFRYEPAQVHNEAEKVLAEDDKQDWFSTESNPEIAAAVAAANAVANKPVDEEPMLTAQPNPAAPAEIESAQTTETNNQP
ncbi:protease subunit, stomatin/prohibitin-like protein [Corynebacterium kutscheri]|uniref:Membrane protease subunit, stomatin/prohibitin n=1 Tax=Corynebacterium kutscheri TaxID=35755 RepID=A0A0F6QZL8_9CORY|nr:SPFH domain-containing protein [Corynebacterium kutscheri]AKE41242.1 membrane protease subunit, stomatin/prohibitin [Corynebacterium kutscheri]VEH08518.1 protease subunit, stomatin/prohibitin-like protein [Corynebacterium kutscheri]VEH09564.1 protease subunit, stomatin/prohibitin-like protein [Corynebacterium kutscheri]VEH79647.1 protease subunit, stomatin/prohibitin-like protein [Corynebacterium kutscheri]